MRFEWDLEKEVLNLRNHGVSFQESVEVFADPNSLQEFDQEHSADELRWIRIGLSTLNEKEKWFGSSMLERRE